MHGKGLDLGRSDADGRSSLVAVDRSVLDRSRSGLVVLDPDHRVETCLGMLVNEVPRGALVSEAMPFLAGLEDVLDDIAAGRRASLALPRVMPKDGPWADRVLSLEFMRAERARSVEIFIREETENYGLEQKVLQQRNELALANEALAEAKQRADVALREKASFLANISHDLKTPLQVIIGNAEILRGDLPKEEREVFLQDVLDNGHFLLALINDLLDASALEADQLKLTEEVVDVRLLLERILSTARRMPNGQERQFELSMDGDQALMADPMRLQRLILNIVGNAVKFTDQGGRIALRARADADGAYVIDVEDDGCGIDPDIMKRVFEPFTMGGSGEGSGLGLHIAKALASLHDAELTLSSEPDVGTTARLRLPGSRMVDSDT